MFKKPFAVQQQNLLSKKDLKGLRAQLADQFPGLDAKVIDELLPEGQVKLLKLDNKGLIYAAGEEAPTFFDPDGRGELYPSLHTLWLHPNMMSELTIHAEVSKFVLNGADLMLPGVIVPANGVVGFGSVTKGQKRCIKCDGNPYPIAVGKMLVNQAQMEKLKGKGLEIVHVFKDTMWDFSGKAIPNAGFSEKVDEITKCSDATYVPGVVGAASSANSIQETPVPSAAAGPAAATDVSPMDASADVGACPSGAANWSQDELLDFCFMQAFQVSLTDEKSLPVEASELYEKHMKPVVPMAQRSM